jgi:hypothetical protein
LDLEKYNREDEIDETPETPPSASSSRPPKSKSDETLAEIEKEIE